MSYARRLAPLLILGALSGPISSASAETTLTSYADTRAFLQDLTPRSAVLNLTGKVLDVTESTKYKQIILADEQGNRTELFRFPELPQPAPGDTIRITGHAYIGKSRENFLSVEEFEVIAHGPCPEPVKIRLAELNAQTHDLMVVRTEGTVVDAVEDEMDCRFTILLIKDETAFVPVPVSTKVLSERRNLIDARVRITGVYHRFVSGIRKVSWPNIQPRGPQDIEVLSPPPENPFTVPMLEKSLYFSTDEVMQMGKRVIEGEVLATWGGNRAMLRTEDGRVINLELASGSDLPPCGATILAAGQPETDLFRINFSSVRWKPVGDQAHPPGDEPPAANAATMFWDYNGRTAIEGMTHGNLLYAEGIIRTLPDPQDDELRFVVDTDGRQVIVDATSTPSALEGLQIGCRVKVTGRCLLLTDSWSPRNAFPQAKGFAIIIRTQDDIVILSQPPWWTPGRLFVLIAILLLLFTGVQIWSLIQRHFAKKKIIERTRLSVELHDTLSQNLAGVACQVTAGNNAIDDDPQTAKARIKAAERMLQSCRTELRHCLFDLRSDMLEEPDFTAAIQKALNQLKDEAAISIRFDARRSAFPDPVAHAILSVIRELTANAIRHGKATNVRIAGSTKDGTLKFSVTDNGSGFDPKNRPGLSEGHFGLEGVRDRLKRVNGSFTISSEPGKGAKATVTLPIPKP